MKSAIVRSIVFSLFAAVASMPLYAQSESEAAAATVKDETIAKVRTDGGVIMISEGGEFETALPDQRVEPKVRLMVSEQSAATVIYDNGCKQVFDKPGVYEIARKCAVPLFAGSSGGGPMWAFAGATVATAVTAYVVDRRNSCSK